MRDVEERNVFTLKLPIPSNRGFISEENSKSCGSHLFNVKFLHCVKMYLISV